LLVKTLNQKSHLLIFRKLNSLLKKQSCKNTIDCVDAQHNLLASAFIAEDTKSVYYLFGGYNTEFKNSGAMTFLLHHLIKDAQQRDLEFNFCGSSKKSIATYFEGFGATENGNCYLEKIDTLIQQSCFYFMQVLHSISIYYNSLCHFHTFKHTEDTFKIKRNSKFGFV
jgi:hypothetical protein